MVFVPPLLVGCSGHALVHTVPLGTQRISTEGPLFLRESMDECYYWTDDQNRLVIAMRKSHHSLLGKFLDREFVLSLVLPGLPAATSRDYRMDRNTARLFSRLGIYPQRGGSTGGIVAVWNFGQGKLKGRFRFHAKQQTYSVLTGWSGDFTSLYLGEFTAVNNRNRGERLLAQTEEAGLRREKPGTLRRSNRTPSGSAGTGFRSRGLSGPVSSAPGSVKVF